MVQVYESEQEQIEAMKRWWKENGISIVLGIVIGVAGIIGYNSWQSYKQSKNEAASAYYIQIMEHLQQGAYDSVASLSDQIIADYSTTSYASLAQLSAAKALYGLNEKKPAQQRLEWVVENGSTEYFKTIAKLRLASLHLANDDTAAAQKVLAGKFAQSFSAQKQVLIGDLAVATEDYAAARTAYIAALGDKLGLANPQLLQYKIANLPPVKEVANENEIVD